MTPLRSLFVDSLLVAVLTACAAAASAQSVTPPPETDWRVTTEGSIYDANAIRPCASATTHLDGQPHIATCTDDSTKVALFVGDEIHAHEPGEYFCRCGLHPASNATLILDS